GFTETHSPTYYSIDLPALVNLVDFAWNQTIVTKAAMVLDLITFDFANHYFKGSFATAHGRAYNKNKVGESNQDPPRKPGVDDSAYLLLGVPGIDISGGGVSHSAVALATSDIYVPPPVLEKIMLNSTDFYECRDRNGIYLDEGKKYGIGTSEENDLMFWWHMSAQIAPNVLEATFSMVEKYKIDPEVLIGSQSIIDGFKWAALLHGTTPGGYSSLIRQITVGVALETFNTYTYRTPYYQLSGVQDYQKGMNGLQEHVWQASLDKYATVWTNWDGVLSFKGGKFLGGWKPRATFYKNLGIVQYDREVMTTELEIGGFIFDSIENINDGNLYPPIHAYFPRWAFDLVETRDHWTFATKNGGYLALYSYEPVEWVSNIELKVKNNARKNVWIVELGSVEDYGTFESFIARIMDSDIKIAPASIGYSIQYTSPSRGLVRVGWNGPMTVNGTVVDLGPYERFENPYCYQEFGTNKTVIKFGNEVLELDFDNAARKYYITCL
ncbi:MAG: hypothetical protein ACTSXP_07025, partial [Promethearchaeota archaeon]